MRRITIEVPILTVSGPDGGLEVRYLRWIHEVPAQASGRIVSEAIARDFRARGASLT